MTRWMAFMLGLGLAGCLSDPQGKTCAEVGETDPACVDATVDADGPLGDGRMGDGPLPDAGDAEPPEDAAASDATVDAVADAVTEPDSAPGECEPGTSRPCGSDVGECVAGQQFCTADGVYDVCLGAVEGSPEICDGLDNDCSGAVDDMPTVGRPCTVGVGPCARDGSLACLAGEDAPVCDAVPAPPGVEICNGIDDDCNGTVDDGLDQDVSTAAIEAITWFKRPAVQTDGARYTAVWLADGQVRFGQAVDGGWAVRPRSLEEYNGDDTIATAVDLVRRADDYVLAVGYDGLGSGIDLFPINGEGERLNRGWVADAPGTQQIALAALEAGVGAVWVEDDPAADQDTLRFVHFQGFGDLGAYQTFGEGGRRLHSPTLVAMVERYAMLWVASNPGAVTGPVYLVAVDPDPRAGGGRRITLCDRETCGGPAAAWLPERAQLVTAWDVPDGGARRVQVAVLDDGGEISHGPFPVGRNGARNATLIPRRIPGEPVTEVAIVWQAPEEFGFSQNMSWLRFDGESWTVSEGAARVTSGRTLTGETAGVYAPDGAGYGVFFTEQGDRFGPDTGAIVSGDFGCLSAR